MSIPDQSAWSRNIAALRRQAEDRRVGAPPRDQARPERPGLIVADRQLVEKVREVVADWRVSPDTAAARAAGRAGDIAALKTSLDALVMGPGFDEVRTLATRSAVGPGAAHVPFTSVTIGLEAEIDLFLGAYGSVGYAADIVHAAETSCGYVFDGMLVGLGVALEVGPQVGLWRKAVGDIEGLYSGGEVGVVDLGLFALFDDDRVEAVFVDASFGQVLAADGMEVLVRTYSMKPAREAETPANHLTDVTDVTRDKSKSSAGHDQVTA